MMLFQHILKRNENKKKVCIFIELQVVSKLKNQIAGTLFFLSEERGSILVSEKYIGVNQKLWKISA